MHKILNTDDSVNACDCCGKTGLKFTFVVELESGDIAHYGSTCVTKHTGKTVPAAAREIENRAAAVRAEKEDRYSMTAAAIALDAKRRQAYGLGLVGVPFRDFCATERAAADAVRAEIFA